MKKILISLLLVAMSLSLCFLAVSCGASDGKGDAPGDHGGTNTQDVGVDEGDIVKMYGNRIYNLQCDGLTVSDVNAGEIKVVAYYSFDNSKIIPIEMYVSGENVIIIAGKIKSFFSDSKYKDYYYQDYDSLTVSVVSLAEVDGIETVDLSGSAVYSMEVNTGYFVTSRLVDSTNKLYLAFYTYSSRTVVDDEVDNGNVIAPIAYREKKGGATVENKSMIVKRIPNSLDSYTGNQVTGFMSVDIDDLSAGATAKGYYGAHIQDIYMTADSFYPIFYYSGMDVDRSGGCYSNFEYSTNSYVCKIDQQTLDSVYGVRLEKYRVYDRYALKEFDNTLYIVATKTTGTGTRVIALNSADMGLISKLENIAEFEEVKSVTYEEEEGRRYCYITTFRQTDPLFKVDITDPSDMRLLGSLAIVGYSAHLQVVGENKMIGVGYDGTATGANTRKIRVNLYDTSGDAPDLIDYLTVEDVMKCEAVSDPRTICFLSDGVFAFTVNRTVVKETTLPSGYISTSYIKEQMLLIFKVDGNALVAVNYLSNFGDESNDTYGEIGNLSYYETFRQSISRARYYEGYLYTISDGSITSYKVEDGFVVTKQYLNKCSTSVEQFNPTPTPDDPIENPPESVDDSAEDSSSESTTDTDHNFEGL